MLDFAIWAAGCVVVPVYETSSPDQVAWILSDSGATAAFVEKQAHADVVESVRGEAPDLGPVWVIEDDVLGTLASAGADVPDSELEARRATLGRRQPGHADLHQRHHGRPRAASSPTATSSSRSTTA